MAFPVKTTFTFLHASQPDVLTPGFISAPVLKADFDSQAQELLTFVNAILTALGASTSGNGTELIGAPAITGVSGSTLYAQLTDLRAQIVTIIGGAIPPSSVTTAMIQNLAVTAAKIALATITNAQIAADTITLSNLAPTVKTGNRGGKIYTYRNNGGL